MDVLPMPWLHVKILALHLWRHGGRILDRAASSDLKTPQNIPFYFMRMCF